ncbi:hypothetical protein GCM10029964_125120 [Kibdelosporangium lantanae]
MFALVITWIGIVLGTSVLLLMALGPVIVEMDGWLAARKRAKRRAAVRATTRQARPNVTVRTAAQH